MEFLFQFMSDIFSSEEEFGEMQLLGDDHSTDFSMLEDEDLLEDDLFEKNIFAIGEFH